jgi:hypothetical protein
MHFQQNFGSWTSGNNDIDKFIQDTQLLAHGDIMKALEWIPYDKFYDIKYIAKDGFSKIYKAIWTDGRTNSWNDEKQNWNRINQNMIVDLKNLHNTESITLNFVNKAGSIYF